MARIQTLIAGGDEYTEQAVKAFMESGQHDGYAVPEPPAPVEEQSPTTQFPDKYPRNMIYSIPTEEIEKKVEALVKTMTFGEKINLLYVDGSLDPEDQGGTTMYGLGVARLGVPVQRQPDGSCRKWILAKGPREVMIGSASNRILFRQRIDI